MVNGSIGGGTEETKDSATKNLENSCEGESKLSMSMIFSVAAGMGT